MSDLTPEGLRKRAVEFMDREFNPEDPQTMTEALARVFTALVAEARQEQDTPDILVLPGLRRYWRKKEDPHDA